jgi:hypothetical protein
VRVLGLDIATTTGAAIYDTTADLSAIKPWSFKVAGDLPEEKAGNIGVEMVSILRRERPDMVIIEMPMRVAIQHEKQQADLLGERKTSTINPMSIILPNQLIGAVMGVTFAFGVGWHIITAEQWRKQFLGFGRQKGWDRAAWKKAARERCEMLNIRVTNNDQSDAVGIAFSAPSTDTFRMIQTRRDAA